MGWMSAAFPKLRESASHRPHPCDLAKSLFMQGEILWACSNVYLSQSTRDLEDPTTYIVRRPRINSSPPPLEPFLGDSTWEDLEAVKKFEHTGDGDLSVLDLLQEACIQLQVQDCQNLRCRALRKQMEKVAPLCDWKQFCDWILVSLSC